MIRIKPFTTILRMLAFLMVGIVLLIALFIGWISLSKADHPAEEIIFNGSTLPIMPDTLRLLSWNIGYAGLGERMDFFYDGGSMVRPEESYLDSCMAGILEFVQKDTDAHIFLFQEVDIQAKRSWGRPLAKELEKTHFGHHAYFTLNYDAAFVPVPPASPMGRVHSGLMALSDYQPGQVVRYALPGRDPWPDHLFLPDRCFLLMRFPMVGGKELIVINIHNSAFDEGGVQRAQQVGLIQELLLSEYARGNYVIAGGDWNQSPDGFDPRRIITGDLVIPATPLLADNVFPGWIRAYDPLVPTNRWLDEPFLRGRTQTTLIDYFLLSPNIRLAGVKTHDLGFRWSDHQPVEIAVIIETPR